MATKQTRHWYDRVSKVEKMPKLAWLNQYTVRKLEKLSKEGYRLVKVTNDMYSFDQAEPEDRKYFVMTINGYDKKSNKDPALEWYQEIEPYVDRMICRENWRIVAELDKEKLDDAYYFLEMRKMKKGVTLPVFFMIYAVIWIFMALLVLTDFAMMVQFIVWAMIAAAFGYGAISIGTIFWEIHRIKKAWIDTI